MMISCDDKLVTCSVTFRLQVFLYSHIQLLLILSSPPITVSISFMTCFIARSITRTKCSAHNQEALQTC